MPNTLTWVFSYKNIKTLPSTSRSRVAWALHPQLTLQYLDNIIRKNSIDNMWSVLQIILKHILLLSLYRNNLPTSGPTFSLPDYLWINFTIPIIHQSLIFLGLILIHQSLTTLKSINQSPIGPIRVPKFQSRKKNQRKKFPQITQSLKPNSHCISLNQSAQFSSRL